MLAIALLVGAAYAAGAAVPAGTPVLVELFTSEGCSSCPPADQLLARLAAEQSVPGAVVVPLSLHVDYWNQLGWKDPFSSRRYSERQSDYARRFGSAGRVYTPQVVVSGHKEVVGSDERAVRRAIETEAREPKAFVRVLADAVGSVRVSVAGAAGGSDVILAVVEDGQVSNVTRGENAGRHLAHTAVARELRAAGTVDAAGRFDATVRIESGPGARRVFAFVQERGAGRVLGTSIPVSAALSN